MAITNPRPQDPGPQQAATDAILSVMAATPGPWLTSELVRALPTHHVLDVVLAVTQLHTTGELERVAPATYQLPAHSPAVTRQLNAQRLWGT
jgi:hypothetical protein